MSYPTEWWINDRINAAIRGLAQSHEVHSLRSDVGSLEHSLREARSEIASLRGKIDTLQDAVMQLQRFQIEVQESAAA
jgi:polyhydroxyalkanoate synthesis regulator phasin